MKKMTKDQICEVVRDLLPLYADGGCAPGSRAMVEEHIAGCERCRRQLSAMETPLNLPKPELPKEDIRMKRDFIRIWWVALASFVVIAVAIGLIVFRVYHTENGVTPDNKAEANSVTQVMELWKTEGTEAAVKAMNPVRLYNERATPVSEENIRETYMLNTLNESGCVEAAFQPIVVDGETTYITRGWVEGWNTTSMGVPIQRALDQGNSLEFWYYMLRDCEDRIIVTESVYTAVTGAYSEQDSLDGVFHPVELDGVTYYYYADENQELGYWSNYPEDMIRCLGVEPLTQLDDLMGCCVAMPEAVYQAYVQSCGEIFQNFADYAAYYEAMSYSEFAGQWREQMTQALAVLEEQGLTIADYSIAGAWSSAKYEDGWQFWIDVILSNGETGRMLFTVQGGNAYLYGADSVRDDGTAFNEIGERIAQRSILES